MVIKLFFDPDDPLGPLGPYIRPFFPDTEQGDLPPDDFEEWDPEEGESEDDDCDWYFAKAA